MSGRLICICNFVDEKEIKSLVKKGANSTLEIQHLTRAGTTCGRCLPLIDEIVNSGLKEKIHDQQKKLNLGF